MSSGLEELAKEKFDVVVLGTGLVESILSAALALAGKKVLHLDENDFYGENDGTLSLAQVSSWSQEGSAKVSTLRVLRRHQAVCFGGISTKSLDSKWEEISKDRFVQRNFNLDLMPRLVLCRGATVDILVRSGVSTYLEFKSLDDSFMLESDGSVIRVPCSKSAVFKSKDIGMGEKRQLMKFLQRTMDRATRQSAGDEAVKFLNEAHLNQGRSLARPQNKVDKSSEPLDEKEEDMDFEPFLEQVCQFSAKLRNSVLYAVASLPRRPEPGQLSVASGMERVQRFLGGLGRFGKTAYLCPMYGTSEVSQAFCRLSSVHGGLFILNQTVHGLLLDQDEENVAAVELGEDSVCVPAKVVVASSRYGFVSSPPREKAPSFLVRKILIANGPVLSLAPRSALDQDLQASVKLLKSSAMLGHSPAKRSYPDLARCELVIPPNHPDLCNEKSTVFALQLDSGVEATAPGYFAIHLTMEHESKDFALECLDRVAKDLLTKAQAACQVLKEKVPELVRPSPTSQDQGQQTNSQQPLDEIIKSKAPDLAEQQPNEHEQVLDQRIESTTTDVMQQLEYVYELSFSREVGPSTAYHLNDSLVLVGDVGTGVDFADHVAQAQAIFTRICPGEAFLPPESERKIQVYRGAEEDDSISFVTRTRIPQVVDLRWFSYLGGRMNPQHSIQIS